MKMVSLVFDDDGECDFWIRRVPSTSRTLIVGTLQRSSQIVESSHRLTKAQVRDEHLETLFWSTRFSQHSNSVPLARLVSSSKNAHIVFLAVTNPNGTPSIVNGNSFS